MRYRVLGLVLVIAIVAGGSQAAWAQSGCQECASSTSCRAASARSGCTYGCIEGGMCHCTDQTGCSVTDALTLRDAKTSLQAPGYALALGRGTYLVSDCQKRVYGVAYRSAQEKKVRAQLTTVTLRRLPTREAAQLAAFRAEPYSRHPSLE